MLLGMDPGRSGSAVQAGLACTLTLHHLCWQPRRFPVPVRAHTRAMADAAHKFPLSGAGVRLG